MDEVRFAIVGFGNIGQTHARTLLTGVVPRARLTAVVTQGTAELPVEVARFSSIKDLLTADAADAIVVATPTMTHASLGHAVFGAGCHLVMEKPIAMSTQAAQALVAAQPDGVRAAVMLNQRYHPAYRAIKEILQSQQLGSIVRFNWLMTTWYRPDVYFQVSTWRGTWPGEGGGALLNQCIHNLDVLQWWLGLPDSVVAEARFGKYHSIDVEDEVTALLNYDNGMTGVVVASTGEAPGVNRLDIVGDQGTLSFDGQQLTLSTADQRVSEHCAETREMFGVPSFSDQLIDTSAQVNQHAEVLRSLVDAILDGTPVATPLGDGLGSIELANAMLLSAWQDHKVTLPLNAGLYQNLLDQRVMASGFRQAQELDVQIDMDASYR